MSISPLSGHLVHIHLQRIIFLGHKLIGTFFTASPTFQTGEGGHPGNDSQTLAKSPESAGSHVSGHGSSGPQQIQGRIQRVRHRS